MRKRQRIEQIKLVALENKGSSTAKDEFLIRGQYGNLYLVESIKKREGFKCSCPNFLKWKLNANTYFS
eukprot:CAMPEP_0184011790 /NCGR_PEP_ID=MMETSP0954-20121128/4024_1 /TAXON_ID=627963 /ORGANISM="Aplanochytrium sp, Strain PBS07" /LENGTH=67 /DNA_ID=CAMNT_0026291649 /DNA_START=328 /DNA_END=531 /DNA_ORIENTATION=+